MAWDTASMTPTARGTYCMNLWPQQDWFSSIRMPSFSFRRIGCARGKRATAAVSRKALPSFDLEKINKAVYLFFT